MIEEKVKLAYIISKCEVHTINDFHANCKKRMCPNHEPAPLSPTCMAIWLYGSIGYLVIIIKVEYILHTG